MCVIAFYKKSRPNFETLQKMNQENSDGAGIMYFKKNLVYYKKGITDIKELFNLTKEITLPFVIHFRLASCGGKKLLLTHPFEVTKSSKLRFSGRCKKLLMHNGTNQDFNEDLAAAGIYNDANEEMSDTRAIAMIVAKNNVRFLTTFSEYKHKFILADANLGRFISFGYFMEEDGNFFSNLKWRYSYVADYDGSEFFGNHRGYSNSNIKQEDRYNSDVNRLPTHYQPPVKEYNVQETLSELMNKKNRKRYLRWFERRKTINPTIEFLPTEPDSNDTVDVEKFIREFHDGNKEDITIDSPEQSNVPTYNTELYTRIHEQSDAQFIKEQEQPNFLKKASDNLRRILGLLPIKQRIDIKDKTDYTLFPVNSKNDVDI